MTKESGASDNLKEEIEIISNQIGSETLITALDEMGETPEYDKMRRLLNQLLTTEKKVTGNYRTRLRNFVADALEAKSQKMSTSELGSAELVSTLAMRLRSNLGRSRRTPSPYKNK